MIKYIKDGKAYESIGLIIFLVIKIVKLTVKNI